jgi:plasmid stability protein
VRELKKRAARRNHSAEQEHREILERALLHPKRRSLAGGTRGDTRRRQRRRLRAPPDRQEGMTAACVSRRH